MEPTLSANLFSTDVEQIPTRNGYGEGLVEAGKKDENVVVLCCDLTDSTRSKAFKDAFPERFVEVGVAEQNMAGVAAGMALEGHVPFCSSYAVFNPGRNWDQVRVSICYNKANVCIVGAHAGISVGPDGATHQALEDIAIARVLPGMAVVVPCDSIETRKATVALAQHKGPKYIRFARTETPVMTTKKTPFEIGTAYTMMAGTDISIIGAGPILYEALVAAKELQQEGINAEVINLHTIVPIDEEAILSSIKKTGAVVSVEEHQVAGGVGSAIAEVLAKHHPAPQEFVGMPNSFGESGDPDELLEKYGMKAKHIVEACRRCLKRK